MPPVWYDMIRVRFPPVRLFTSTVMSTRTSRLNGKQEPGQQSMILCFHEAGQNWGCCCASSPGSLGDHDSRFQIPVADFGLITRVLYFDLSIADNLACLYFLITVFFFLGGGGGWWWWDIGFG